MARFLHRYQTLSDFNTDYNGSAYQEPWVSYTTQNEQVDYNKIKVIFTFHIDISHSSFSGPEDYQAEEGMTWGEWVNSEYNTANWFINDDNKVCHSIIGDVWEDKTIYFNGVPSTTAVTQTSSMVITPVQYRTHYESHQGGTN